MDYLSFKIELSINQVILKIYDHSASSNHRMGNIGWYPALNVNHDGKKDYFWTMTRQIFDFFFPLLSDCVNDSVLFPHLNIEFFYFFEY